MPRLIATLATLLALALPSAALATPAPACQFVLGFATLHAMIPTVVGDCLDNEQHNPANGDALQHTTNGLLVWRKADNFTAFTNGYRTWANGPFGVQERLNTQHFAWEDPATSGAGPQLITPDPLQVLRSFYYLINQRDYAAAYALWQIPPAPYNQFVAGYQTTAHVDVAIGTPQGDSAAGHIGIDVSTVLVARQTDGSIRSFAGCYILATVNPGMLPPGTPPRPWLIVNATVHALSGVTSVNDPVAQAALAAPGCTAA